MKKKVFKSGFVSLLGRPNTGKSTLLNALINDKISIVSSIPQTTRHSVRGILHLPQAQIIYVDTPGISLVKKGFTMKMNKRAQSATEGVDLLYYVVDVQRPPHEEERTVMDFIRRQKIPCIMVLNKIDKGQGFLNEYVARWRERPESAELVKYFLPVSALLHKNVDTLIKLTVELLPKGERWYDTATVTDFPLELRLSEVIREKFFQRIKEEVPYSLAVVTELCQDTGPFYRVEATVYVNTFSQKKIVIGSGGALIKEVGTLARKDIQNILKKKVFLQLWVKVVADWQENPRIMKEMGFGEEE